MSTLKAKNQTLQDEFQIKGQWWLPQKKDLVSGILFYNEGEIKLELIGVLSNLKSGFIDEFNTSSENSIILGLSDNGEEFTLLGADKSNFSIISSGFRTETYSIESFLVGGHYNTVEEMSFKSLVFLPTYFSKWIGKSPFKNNFSAEGKLESISFAEAFPFKEYVKPISACIEEVSFSNLSGDYSESVNFNHKGGFKIVPDDSQTFDWFEEVMHKLNNLYTLLINNSSFFESIILYGEEGKQYYYFRQQTDIEVNRKFNNRDVMLGYREIQDSLAIIFNSWFEKQENLKVIIDLYLSDFYLKSNLETRFLNGVQTLEIYHRRTFDGTLFDKTSYLEHASLLIDYAERELPKELALKIKGIMQHGNEYSLSKRLREIVKNLETDTKKYLFGNSNQRDKFIQQLVDTRNYLTHYDKEKKDNLLDSSDKLFYSVIRLKAFMTLILFKEIGIEEGIILSKIQNSKQYSYSIDKIKALLE